MTVKSSDLLLIIAIFSFSNVCAQLTLLKDIDKLPDPVGSGIDARGLTNVNGVLFFSGRSELGYELWKSDGVNTTLVKDINPGTNSSFPVNFINVNGIVYFTVNDPQYGNALWKSDGTNEGTLLVKKLSGIAHHDGAYSILVAGSSTVYIATRKSPWLWDLWGSDGTNEGTHLLFENFYNGELSKRTMAVIGNTLYFRPTTHDSRYLWKSDGTIGGTVLLDVLANPSGYIGGQFIVMADILYFLAYIPSYGAELWKSDGTIEGTSLVKDIRPGSEGGLQSNFKQLNGELLFNATDGTNSGTWKTDGTSEGTQFVSTKRIGDNYAIVGDRIYYILYNSSTWRYELWYWNGPTTTHHFVQITTNPVNGLVGLNGSVYFVANDDDPTPFGGHEIWTSNGTAEGTFPISDFPYKETIGARAPSYLTKVNSTIFFVVAEDSESGNELWKTDGTLGNLVQLTDVPYANNNVTVSSMTPMNGSLYFAAGDETYGLEPWKSDGTFDGTTILKDIAPGGPQISSAPANFNVIENTLFFVAQQKLWKSDGTMNGTTSVANVGSVSAWDKHVRMGDALYFPDATGNQLKKTEPPYVTATSVKSFSGAMIHGLVFHKGNLYFNAEAALWRSDGTESSTVRIKEFHNGPSRTISVGDFLYFIGNDGVHGDELWRSDGTETGTAMVKDITPGISSTSINSFINFNGVVVFLVEDDVHGSELWRSDGTLAGTSILKDIMPGVGGSSITGMVVNDELLYFSANDGVHGQELWRTDGTTIGTQMFLDINPGLYSSEPYNLLPHQGVLYFTAYDNAIRTLWKTNGKLCGTTRVTNNTSVITGGVNRSLQIVNNTIFVEGWEPLTGWEIYLHDISTDPVVEEACKLNQQIVFEPIEDKVYGTASFNVIATSNSSLPVSLTTSTPNLISINGDRVTILSTGLATITANQSGNINFNAATSIEEYFNIDKANQTITFQPIPGKLYGDASFNVVASASSTLPITYASSNPLIASIEDEEVTIHETGEVSITATQVGNENYNSTTATVNFSVQKATLTVTPQNKTKVYYEENPGLTFTIEGFKGEDTIDDLEELPTLSTQAVTSSAVGEYAITVHGGSDENYNFIVKEGKLTIEKASLTIKPDDKTKVYYEENPVLTYTVEGYKGEDTIDDLEELPTLSTQAVATSAVGGYTITVQGGSDDNYNFIVQEGRLTIEKASLTIKPDDKTKAYYEENPVLTYTVEGYKGEDIIDDLEELPTLSTQAVTASAVGEYAIIVHGGSDDNYTFIVQEGKLTIEKASLRFKPEDKTKVYYEENPPLTYTIEGFKGFDTIEDIERLPLIFTLAETTSGVGNYLITLSGGQDENYSFTIDTGILTIQKADQIISFMPVGDVSMNNERFMLVANSSTGLPIQFSTSSSNLFINGNQVVGLFSGKSSITASQAGNENINPASATQEFCLNPSRPILTMDGDLLNTQLNEAEVNLTYQWFKDGNLIIGEVESQLRLKATGKYSVQGVAKNCYSEVSDEINFIVTDLNGSISESILVYPNPVVDKLIIESSQTVNNVTTISSTGVETRVSFTKNNDTSIYEIDIANLSSGFYLLKIVTRRGSTSKRIVVQR